MAIINPYKKIGNSSEENSELKPLPDNFKDFAHLCTIRSGVMMKPFDLYQYQDEIVGVIEDHQNTVIAKTRQLGLTELISCYFLYHACKNEAFAAAVFSKTQGDTSNIAGRIRKMADSLKDYIKLEGDSLTLLQIKGGGKIYFRSSTPEGARGLESIWYVLFDEFAFIKDAERIMTSVIPATSMVGESSKIIYVSTPNGQNGIYWDLLDGSNQVDIQALCADVRTGIIEPLQYFTDLEGWGKVIVHWLAHPVYSAIPNYLEVQRKKTRMTEDSLNQEYNLAFNTADNTVFLPSEIQQCITSVEVGQGYQIHTFNDPKYGHLCEEPSTYIIGIDTATTGADYFSAVVINTTAQRWLISDWYYKQASSCSITQHIDNIIALIKKYRIQNVAIEVNAGGAVILEMLKGKLMVNGGSMFNRQMAGIPNCNFLEVKTTSVSKPVLIDRLRRRLQDITIGYAEYTPIIDEMENFTRIEGKMQASNGAKDDFIMATCVALAFEGEELNLSQPRPNSYGVNAYNFGRNSTPGYVWSPSRREYIPIAY